MWKGKEIDPFQFQLTYSHYASMYSTNRYHGHFTHNMKDNKVDIFENILTTHSCIHQIGMKTPEKASPSLETLHSKRNRTASASRRHDYPPSVTSALT